MTLKVLKISWHQEVLQAEDDSKRDSSLDSFQILISTYPSFFEKKKNLTAASKCQ